jgi:hypothetical protein
VRRLRRGGTAAGLQPVDVSGAAQPQQVGEFDQFVQVGHGAAHDPQRVDAFESQLPQLILSNVLDVTRSGVET